MANKLETDQDDADNQQTIPLPQPSDLSKPHWQACQEGKLKVQKCNQCDHYIFIPQPLCTRCQANDWQWVESTGKGTIYSYTIVHRAPRPQFKTPYAVVIIELEEGWFMLSNITDYNVDQITTGMPVAVRFEKYNDEITLPLFSPVS